MAGEDCDKTLKAFLKKTPKKDPPKPYQLEAMNKAINDIFSGKGIPRIDCEIGGQTVYQGRGGVDEQRWKGALEWSVIKGDNDMRILTKDLGNGKTKIGFTIDHYKRIFDVIVE
ncbi:hypothetical protein [Burkholderia pseudomallei]|uniref:hypothetical protein n=1 Tax=Burkholderia pseudomallei TaxID=28450 RepID=UPI0024DFF395|nr:hypothetical protein [Burkholderia pseudomallei]